MLIQLLLANQDLTEEQVGRVFIDERRGARELYFLRICTCLGRGSPWNREWHRSRPDREKCPNLCLVCFDCQLFLCAAPTEGALREGKRVVAPHSDFPNGVSG